MTYHNTGPEHNGAHGAGDEGGGPSPVGHNSRTGQQDNWRLQDSGIWGVSSLPAEQVEIIERAVNSQGLRKERLKAIRLRLKRWHASGLISYRSGVLLAVIEGYLGHDLDGRDARCVVKSAAELGHEASITSSKQARIAMRELADAGAIVWVEYEDGGAPRSIITMPCELGDRLGTSFVGISAGIKQALSAQAAHLRAAEAARSARRRAEKKDADQTESDRSNFGDQTESDRSVGDADRTEFDRSTGRKTTHM